MYEVDVTQEQLAPMQIEKPRITQKALTSVEQQNLTDRFNSFSRSRAPIHIAAGDFLLHLGSRKAKRPEEIREVGPNVQRVFLSQDRAYLQVARVDMQEEKPGIYTSSDVFTNFILHNANISEESKRTLAEYAANPENVLVMIRSEKPTKEFRQALSRHANAYNGSISLLTQADVLIDGLHHEFGEHAPGGDKNEDTSERQSLHDLVTLANNGKSIHFAALTPDASGVVPDAVKNALRNLNEVIDPYEFVYWTLSSLSENQRRSQVEALALLGAGAALPVGLEKLGDVVPQVLQHMSGLSPQAIAQSGPVSEMMIGSGIGDMFAGFAAGRGRERQKKRVARMKDYFDSLSDRFKDDKFKRHKIVALCTTLGIPAAAIGITALTGLTILGLPLFFAASPIVGTALLGIEAHKRMKMIPKSQEEVRDILKAYMGRSRGIARFLAKKFPDNRLLTYLSDQPSITERLANRFPKSTLALYDIMRNPTAVGGWAGTVVSLPTVLLLEALLPSVVSLPLMVAVSTMISENTFGTIFGMNTIRQDPWENFEKELPRVQKLIQFGKEARTSE